MAQLKYIYHVPRYFTKLSHHQNGKTLRYGDIIKVTEKEFDSLLKTYKSFFIEIKEQTKRVEKTASPEE